MYKNLYDFLGNDGTNIYEVKDSFPKYIEPWEVQRFVNDSIKNRCYYFDDLLSFGHYDNSTDVHRSNHRVFLKEFQDNESVIVITYPDGGASIGIDLLCTDQSIMDSLTAFAMDSVMDETDRSSMKEEMIKEAWESWIKRNFTHTLEKKFKADWIDPDDEQLYELFQQLQQQSGHFAQIGNGGTVYIEIDRLLLHLYEAPGFLNLEYWNAA